MYFVEIGKDSPMDSQGQFFVSVVSVLKNGSVATLLMFNLIAHLASLSTPWTPAFISQSGTEVTTLKKMSSWANYFSSKNHFISTLVPRVSESLGGAL